MKTTMLNPVIFSPCSVLDVFKINNKIQGFNIPIYQRLYAWGVDEVRKLLEDIKDNENSEYFLGNITLFYNEESNYLDVIDGQQRLTTLWLIGLVFKLKEIKKLEWKNFIIKDKEPILRFTGRKEDNKFINKLINSNNLDIEDDKDINIMMLNAIKEIKIFVSNLENKGEDIEKYAADVLGKVKMAAVYLPDKINLNKYFEDMNNRSVQLEAHHILKAKLLKKVKVESLDEHLFSGDNSIIEQKKNEKQKQERRKQNKYALVWDAISQMNQYIEYGFEGTLQENREQIHDNKNKYFDFDKKYDDTNNEEFNSDLKELIELGKQKQYNKDKKGKKDYEEDKVRSIINFPEFLLLCLSIHLKIKGKDRIYNKDTELVGAFEDNINNIDESFFEFILKARIVFDKYIIKSIINPNGLNQWGIRKIKNKKDLDGKDKWSRRENLNDNIVQYQSMLHVSTSYHLWLFDLMYFFMVSQTGLVNNELIENKLREIDLENNKKLPDLSKLGYGGENRYWFNKLDYLLWKKWKKSKEEGKNFENNPLGINLIDSKISNFQFRNNRSKEHVYPRVPRSPKESEKWEHENLEAKKNRFGNLALIGSRSNSSYNNQMPSEKRKDFKHRTEKYGIESLKLLYIYQKENWMIKDMCEHENEMYKILEQEYSKPQQP